eukprot:3388287-Pyramimonas_sp.AAC.1
MQHLNPNAVIKNWFKESKGPLSDVLLWCWEVGWTVLGPTSFLDLEGVTLDVLKLAPAFISKRFETQYKNSRIQNFAKFKCHTHPQPL